MKINFNSNKAYKFLSMIFSKFHSLLMLFFIVNLFYPSCLFSNELDIFLKDNKLDIQKEFTNGENSVKAFGKNGGSHLGILYLTIENGENKLRHYRLNMGPIYNIVTQDTLPYLKENQFLVISATGGTGQHHVFGCVINIEKDDLKIQSIIPLYGHSVPAGTNCALKYQIKGYNYDKNKKTIALNYDSFFDDPSSEDMETIKGYLKFKSLENKFEVVVTEGPLCNLKASDSITKALEMNICHRQDIEILKLDS
ncbi:MAG: hypothetical protein ACRYGR_07770 [Janthinobacterium lividum]